MKSKLKEKQSELMLTLYKQDYTIQEIGDIFNVSSPTVSRRLSKFPEYKQMGQNRKLTQQKLPDLYQLASLKSRGASLDEIAQEMGVSHTTVAGWLKKYFSSGNWTDYVINHEVN